MQKRKFVENNIFLIDAVGALLSGTLLLVVVTPLYQEFGMPKKVLYWLSAIAYAFSLYSFCCAFTKSDQRLLLLRVIAVANYIYCILIVILLIINEPTLTLLGLAYFIGEITVIICLASLEIRIASSPNAAT
ncbi:hypothetical protein [Parapedobacter tibetensis]|uniref:hypothetical protein n=1 Tax=Parapedobacter tibetensis TaxID=2972951 RepID=UPI00214D2D66|nr:hypothetical protein [Parapedobacter tibetensis]